MSSHGLLLNVGYAHNFEYSPNVNEVFEAATDYRKEHSILPASEDSIREDGVRNHLLIVNPQRDFACSGGSMFRGDSAVDASITITRFIYNNVSRITKITPTLTNHFPFQIMFPSFWKSKDGGMPSPYHHITAKSVRKEEWLPNPDMALWLCRDEYDWLFEQVIHYCEELEKQGLVLRIYPFHCMHGSSGYSIVGVIDEARLFHSWVRSIQAECEVNGSNPFAENYSFLGPAVTSTKDEGQTSWKNVPALSSIVMSDNLILAGHYRVGDTATDILKALGSNFDEWPCRLFYLENGVVNPERIPSEFTPIKNLDDIPKKEPDNGASNETNDS